MVRRIPCRICRRWFLPDARVGERQYTCSAPECQTQRQRRKQAQWRRRNPDYFVGRRWQEATAGEGRAPSRSPPPLEQVPWDVVQSQMQSKPAVIVGLFGRLLLTRAQSQSWAQAPDIAGETSGLPPHRPQSQMEARRRSGKSGLRAHGAADAGHRGGP